MTTTDQRPAAAAVPTAEVAHKLEAALRPFVGGDLPVRLRAWDGSEAGPVGAPLVELRSRDAVRRLLWHPGELGAAQAYVTREIEVHHDLDEALTHVWSVAAARGLSGVRPSPAAFVRALRAAVDVGAVGRAPRLPDSQARVRGRLHSKLRDRRAISHHYDLSNEFYSLILDPSMAYSSGYWRSDDPSYGVADAQRDKLDLVCQKIGLGPGMRFLDIGCGWGSLSLHAAQHYGAQVTGVTIAAEQKKFIDARVRERGLEHLVEIRLQDYREIGGRAVSEASDQSRPLNSGPFDAVASIEMGEHVGEQNYGTYAQVLHDAVAPGGRVLIQQMSRSGGRHGHPGGGPFIESFIAPDMHMRPVGETVAYLERSGLEVRDVHGLREHYVRTVAGWMENFEANLDRLTELVGEEVVRVWRLYLVGGAMSFRDGRMGVDQILMVRPGGPHTLPPVRTW
jgi:cyclopropane-fatty-acyl-phospholipid synthase